MPDRRPCSVTRHNVPCLTSCRRASKTPGAAAQICSGRPARGVDPRRDTPRFTGDQLARRNVPDVDPDLVVAIHAAGGDVTQVECCRPSAADVADVADDFGDEPGLLDAHLADVAEARRDERQAKVGNLRRPYRCPVERRSLPAASGEQFSGGRGVDGAGEHAVVVGDCHRGRPHRMAVHVVGRTVDRVEVPGEARRAGSGRALLADDRVAGSALVDPLDEQRLGGTVVFGDEIGRRRLGRRSTSSDLGRPSPASRLRRSSRRRTGAARQASRRRMAGIDRGPGSPATRPAPAARARRRCSSRRRRRSPR